MLSKGQLLYKELSYQLVGCFIETRKNFGPGHKEKFYHEALAEELKSNNINFEREKPINIYHPKTGKRMNSSYRPDFLIDNKIILEIKALPFIPKQTIDQLYDYLRNSEYELGYFVNFAAHKLTPKRIIYTNDQKPWLNLVRGT